VRVTRNVPADRVDHGVLDSTSGQMLTRVRSVDDYADSTSCYQYDQLTGTYTFAAGLDGHTLYILGFDPGPNFNDHQPPPKPSASPAVWDLVLRDIALRDSAGEAKYGTRLQPFNGRDALVDAYQEALDLVVYLRQAIYERDGK
jgi:hypothetical protein